MILATQDPWWAGLCLQDDLLWIWADYAVSSKLSNTPLQTIQHDLHWDHNLYLYYMDLVMISMEVVLDSLEDTA